MHHEFVVVLFGLTGAASGKHKHVLVSLTITPLPLFYDPREGNSFLWPAFCKKERYNESVGRHLFHTQMRTCTHTHAHSNARINAQTQTTRSPLIRCVLLQVCAQVYETHEGARLQREECVWHPPHHSRPALWLSTPPVFTAGP